MAISQGDLVSVRNNLTTNFKQQPPFYGVAIGDEAAGVVDVLWQDGRVESGILADQLDMIEEPIATILADAKGRAVQVRVDSSLAFGAQSPSFTGQCVDIYRRNAGGDTPVLTDTFLVKMYQTGLWLEVGVTQLQILPGR